MCSLVCPYAAITSDRRNGKAVKCDLCDGSPACEAVCAPGALSFEVETQAAERRRRSAADALRSGKSGRCDLATPSR